jgi:hypothetical protein
MAADDHDNLTERKGGFVSREQTSLAKILPKASSYCFVATISFGTGPPLPLPA